MLTAEGMPPCDMQYEHVASSGLLNDKMAPGRDRSIRCNPGNPRVPGVLRELYVRAAGLREIIQLVESRDQFHAERAGKEPLKQDLQFGAREIEADLNGRALDVVAGWPFWTCSGNGCT
jgi:hypothetical protein